LSPDKSIAQARYIFITGKLLRRHIFSTLARAEENGRKCACSDLSLAQFNLLMAVQANEGITGGELAALLGVSPPSISVMVERLVERELLVRERSAQDRRKVVLRLSRSKAQELARIEEQMLASFVGLVEEIGEETADKWVAVLGEVEKVLQRKFAREAKR